MHPENPEQRKLKQISESLKKGSVFVFPTDTVYALVACANSKEGTEALYKLKELPKNKPLALLCSDISMASQFLENLPNSVFRLMKKVIPGPFTFILRANKSLPKPCIVHHKDRLIGIRFPDHIYLQELLKVHGEPLTSTSVYSDEYVNDPEAIDSLYGSKVAGVIDGGINPVEMSTILNCVNEEIIVEREGKGFSTIQSLL